MTAVDERAELGTQVWAALGTVRDPELDQPVTELGFVTSAEVDGSCVRVRLRLPTYFCAPNFAYLMVADAHDAVRAIPGVSEVDVQLADHFAAEEINGGVAEGAGFAGAFPAQATGELTELRRTFQRKAHLACLERACRKLIESGWRVDELAHVQLGDLPDSPERASLVRRRDELGMPTDDTSHLFTDDDGNPVEPETVAGRLRFAKAVRVSVDGNAAFCRGLLRTRYPEVDEEPREERS
ncbi:iron-sulfur cluster assembly protein [Actinophytocola sp.]|jgi:metal-sulfur cluster biosynthetic enzyme|uniref:iron-sulfur cluster assembly protein n=1 Tax=Actinophytocola sp. TaxID=1872138 RepID=UPI002ED999D8